MLLIFSQQNAKTSHFFIISLFLFISIFNVSCKELSTTEPETGLWGTVQLAPQNSAGQLDSREKQKNTAGQFDSREEQKSTNEKGEESSPTKTTLILVVPDIESQYQSINLLQQIYSKGLLNLQTNRIEIAVPFNQPVRIIQLNFSASYTLEELMTGFPKAMSGGISPLLTFSPEESEQTVHISLQQIHCAQKELLTFQFENPAAIAEINGEEIRVTVPHGTDRSALIPTFTTSGVEVLVNGQSQISGITPNDFRIPVIYTVTAEDYTMKDYYVTVSEAPSSAKEITSFRFAAAGSIGWINNNHISISTEGIDIDQIVATFTTTGKQVFVDGILQESGVTVNDFTNDVIYTVVAEDGSTQEYIVQAYYFSPVPPS